MVKHHFCVFTEEIGVCLSELAAENLSVVKHCPIGWELDTTKKETELIFFLSPGTWILFLSLDITL